MRDNFYFLSRSCTRLLLLFAFFFSPVLAWAQGLSKQDQARLQAILEEFQNNPDNPYVGGMAAAIKLDELATWKGTTGYAARNIDADNNLLPGGTPYTTEHQVILNSVTKMFTAALVVELSLEGKLSLDDPVCKYLPLKWFNPTLNEKVTIRQLLKHQSGYSDFVKNEAFQAASLLLPNHIWRPMETMLFVKQLHAPGTEYFYTTTTYVLLGAIAEVVTGRPVEKLYREYFLDRLGLKSTFLAVREPKSNPDMMAAPHENMSVLAPYRPILRKLGLPNFPDGFTNISRFPLQGSWSAIFTGGAMVSNVNDMVVWGDALFKGKALSQAALDTMLNSISPVADYGGDQLGYGLFINKKISEKDLFIGHPGRGAGYHALLFHQPDRGITIALTCNYGGAKLYEVAKALYEALPDYSCGRKNEKIEVCYRGRSLCVSPRLVPALLRGGAYLGACEPGNKATEQVALLSTEALLATAEAGLEEPAALKAYPNPFADQLTVDFTVSQEGPVTLTLLDINGKVVATHHLDKVAANVAEQLELDTHNLPAGLYICRLHTVSGISHQKLLLQR